jgi:hypothetical protein
VISCSLDEQGLREQAARYARLASSVTTVDREEGSIRFSFGEDLDLQILEKMVDVERDCCPFFRFAFDGEERALTVSVKRRELLPALDAIASELGGYTTSIPSRWSSAPGATADRPSRRESKR